MDPKTGAVLTIAGNLTLQPDFQDGQSTTASFNKPYGIGLGLNLYVSDTGNNLVRKINGSRYVTTFGGVSTQGSKISVRTILCSKFANDHYGGF